MSATVLRDRYDVVIAGARVAGASTAMLLARKGFSVLLVDPVPRGRDTLSTHALMRGGVLQLRRWGLLDRLREAGTPPLPVTTFDYGEEVISVPIKPKDGVDALFAPRRTVLDPILVQAAEEAGVHVVFGAAVSDLVRDGEGRVRGAWIRGLGDAPVKVGADLVVGADGLRSKVARLVEAPVEHSATYTTSSMYGYWGGLEVDEYRWYFRPGVGAGIIPTNDGNACVFVSVAPERFHGSRMDWQETLFHQTVRSVDPALADQLTTGRQVASLRAFPGTPGFLKRSWGPGWALVGDAGYFRDPLTAHGITDALRDAELLARAVERGGDEALRDYQATRDSVAREFLAITDAIASLGWDMDEVKHLHHRLSKSMNACMAVIQDWDENGSEGRRAA